MYRHAYDCGCRDCTLAAVGGVIDEGPKASARTSGQLPAPAASHPGSPVGGAGSGEPNELPGAESLARSPLADAIRFVFQKHERALWSNVIQMNDRSVAAECTHRHAHRMFVAAVLELAQAIEDEIDRRIARRASPGGTYFQGGRL